MNPLKLLGAWLLCRIAPSPPRGVEERAAVCLPEPVVGVTADDFITEAVEDAAAETWAEERLGEDAAFCDWMMARLMGSER